MEKAAGRKKNKLAKLARVLILTFLLLSFLEAFGVLQVPHAQAAPGTHEITVVYYKVLVREAHNDWFQGDEGNWYFRLVVITPEGSHVAGLWEDWYGPFGTSDGETHNFGNNIMNATWRFYGTAEYRVEAQEADDTYPRAWDPDSLSSYRRVVNTWEYERNVNTWIDERLTRGSTESWDDPVIHYVKFKVSNLNPTIGAISGPDSGFRGERCTFTASGSDPEDDSLTYQWSVDDTVIRGATESTFTYAFPTVFSYGRHTVSCRALDYFNVSSASVSKSFYIQNRGPTIGGIDGPTDGEAGVEYTFHARDVYDPDGDVVGYYRWYVDGVQVYSGSPNPGGGNATYMSYTFPSNGLYTVSVVATDSVSATESGAERADSEESSVQVQIGVGGPGTFLRPAPLYAATAVGVAGTTVAVAGAVFARARRNRWPSRRTMFVAVGVIGLAAASTFVLFTANPPGSGSSGNGSSAPGGAVVTTRDATGIMSLFATLNGELTSMGGASSVEVYFQWGETAGSLTNETPRQTLTSPGAFSSQTTGMIMPGRTYYFRARAGSDAYGATLSFYVP